MLEQIDECLNRDDAAGALEIFRGMRLAELRNTAGEMGLPMYRIRSKVDAIEKLSQWLPRLTKTAIDIRAEQDRQQSAEHRVAFLRECLANHDARVAERDAEAERAGLLRVRLAKWRHGLFVLVYDELIKRGVHPADAYSAVAIGGDEKNWRGLPVEVEERERQAAAWCEQATLAGLPVGMSREQCLAEIETLEAGER